MKSIALFLILLITPFTIMVNIDDFSINQFINSLKEEGLFELILQIKGIYGQDVAIISCEELNKNNCGNCQNLVMHYMPNEFNRNSNGNSDTNIDSKSNNHGGFMKQTKDKIIEQIISEMTYKIKNILKKKLTPEKSESFTYNISEKFYGSLF